MKISLLLITTLILSINIIAQTNTDQNLVFEAEKETKFDVLFSSMITFYNTRQNKYQVPNKIGF